MYGKIENEKIIYASKDIIIDGKRVINPTEEMMGSLGYKPIISTEYPRDDKHYKQSYVENEDHITLVWLDNEDEYWATVDYEEAVNNEIRKRYNESQEFAILRQKEEKPDDYAEYYNYCEECKAYVKNKKRNGGK
jgi:hypothetical protein